MALHGDVRVNGTLIAVWVARRLSPLDGDGEHQYAVEVLWDTPTLPHLKRTYRVVHAYRDGATALAAKVLTLAAADAPPPPAVP